MLTTLFTVLAAVCALVAVAGSYLVPVSMAIGLSTLGLVFATRRGGAIVKSLSIEHSSSRNWRRLKVVTLALLAGVNAVVFFDSLERLYWIIDLGKY